MNINNKTLMSSLDLPNFSLADDYDKTTEYSTPNVRVMSIFFKDFIIIISRNINDIVLNKEYSYFFSIVENTQVRKNITNLLLPVSAHMLEQRNAKEIERLVFTVYNDHCQAKASLETLEVKLKRFSDILKEG